MKRRMTRIDSTAEAAGLTAGTTTAPHLLPPSPPGFKSFVYFHSLGSEPFFLFKSVSNPQSDQQFPWNQIPPTLIGSDRRPKWECWYSPVSVFASGCIV